MNIQIEKPSHSQIVDAMYLAELVHQESRFADLPFDKERVVRLGSESVINPQRFIRVALDGQAVVGVLAAKLDEFAFCDQPFADEVFFAVAESHRGTYAAVKLAKAYGEWAKEQGCHSAWITPVGCTEPVQLSSFLGHIGFAPVCNAHMMEVHHGY